MDWISFIDFLCGDRSCVPVFILCADFFFANDWLEQISEIHPLTISRQILNSSINDKLLSDHFRWIGCFLSLTMMPVNKFDIR